MSDKNKNLNEIIDESISEETIKPIESINLDKKSEEVSEENKVFKPSNFHKEVEFLKNENLLKFEEDEEKTKITFKDIENKKWKELTKEERKVAFGHLFIITIFLVLNFLIIIHFINISANDRVTENNQYQDILTEENIVTDSEYTRYITEETLEDMNENSKWKKDKGLNEKLEEVFKNQKNLEDIQGYELEGELE